MKKVLLIGKLAINIPSIEKLVTKNVELFSATNLDEVKDQLQKNRNKIDIVITGAGIDLDKRLEIIKTISEINKDATIHMKDWNSGPEGFVPFINSVLNGFVN